MSERKVINKYIPPDFDPSDRFSLPRNPKRPKTVRVMLPFSMRCSTCGEFIYKGRKFNARKETVHGEEYLSSVPVFRFYIRCVWCSSEITYKTDPKNADYEMEAGGTRNAEPWREEARETEALKAKRRFEEELNPMRAVENKSIDSKREIDIQESLEELRARKAELERASEAFVVPAASRANPRTALPELSPEDESEIQRAFSPHERPLAQRAAAPAAPKRPAPVRLDPLSLGIRPKPSPDPGK